jgi:predicted RNA binding protein YcfA (HicA-like mRNA interferase family)
VKAPLAQVWEMFEYPCGQRRAPILREQVDRLRRLGELWRPDAVAESLKRMSAKTADRLLAHQRQVRQWKRQRRAPIHRLLYQRVPVKLPNEWSRDEVGNLQLDLVVHGGRSMAGEYVHTLSAVDIASGWWEGEPQMGRSQKAAEEGFDARRLRFPFRVREVHPDNDSALLNDRLWKYCRKRRIAMSRSRPYEKNDNAWVERKNWTHVRKVVGYRRYDRPAEQELLRTLYRKLAEFQNSFQPVMKLKEKVREGGKVHRVYDEPKTPYQRLREAGVPTRKRGLPGTSPPARFCSTIEEVKGKELVRRLRRAGVDVAGRSGGTGHLVARYRGRKAPVPMHGDRDLGPDFVRMLRKDLGLDPRRVL